MAIATDLVEVRWHGRGGQGAVLGASILGTAAALYEGKHAQSFPSFGAERRGAPVIAFTRISGAPIRTRSAVYHPSLLIVLDDSLFSAVRIADGALDGARILVNTRKSASEIQVPSSLFLVPFDATAVARATLGVPIVNTAMLGALAAVTGLVSIESVKRAIADVLPPRLVARNVAAAQAAYEAAR